MQLSPISPKETLYAMALTRMNYFNLAGLRSLYDAAGSATVIMENRPVPPEELADRIGDVDILLVEGYKSGHWRKIGMRREALGKDWAVPPAECLAVITDGPCPDTVPRFGFSDVGDAADFLQKDMNGL